MAMTKLTLSADSDLVARAKKFAAQNHTSLSSMFTRLLSAMTRQRGGSEPLGPITRKATGMIRLPRAKNHERILEEALADKYGI